ncbi:hypothetical protein R0137_16870 [Congregibacter brevis]|uniref:Uncharacterized protein n=1 Tax=Congregibacter brevis TaxID=3081201 RepID=A0ABZ0IDZ2_9GAMM|nr:hypothetical protein R0137_16870 [Congregibacter sp. IMCC45268]
MMPFNHFREGRWLAKPDSAICNKEMDTAWFALARNFEVAIKPAGFASRKRKDH